MEQGRPLQKSHQVPKAGPNDRHVLSAVQVPKVAGCVGQGCLELQFGVQAVLGEPLPAGGGRAPEDGS